MPIKVMVPPLLTNEFDIKVDGYENTSPFIFYYFDRFVQFLLEYFHYFLDDYKQKVRFHFFNIMYYINICKLSSSPPLPKIIPAVIFELIDLHVKYFTLIPKVFCLLHLLVFHNTCIQLFNFGYLITFISNSYVFGDEVFMAAF